MVCMSRWPVLNCSGKELSFGMLDAMGRVWCLQGENFYNIKITIIIIKLERLLTMQTMI